MMPQICPVHLELAVIVHVHQLVHEGVLHVSPTVECSLAEYDRAEIRAEAARAGFVTRGAYDVVRRDRAA
jgi:hypothetical protein